MTHYREQNQEHPGVAACSIPPNEEGITRIVDDVDCPKCLKLMAAWVVKSGHLGYGLEGGSRNG